MRNEDNFIDFLVNFLHNDNFDTYSFHCSSCPFNKADEEFESDCNPFACGDRDILKDWLREKYNEVTK